MLSAPIILYDYPQIAPESPGDLFDGPEIDEILALRILTLTDAEKEEVRTATIARAGFWNEPKCCRRSISRNCTGALRGIK